MIKTASRLNDIGEYYFSQKLREIDELNKQGKNIINLGIGSPDLPPHESVIEVLQNESLKATTHGYQSYKGSPIFRNSIKDWYLKKYNVSLNADTEILPLLGSKEGIMHICMTYFEEGDFVFVPNPGYPTYSSAVKLSGSLPLLYSLVEDNLYQPNFEELETIISHKKPGSVKALFCNYPHMPSGTNGNKDIFENLIAFGKKHNLLIIHDNPYSFILNDNPISILETNGALEIAIELNSLSKSHNMAGWRIGMMCAAKERIDDIIKFKSNMDSGMFLPAQLAAAKALTLDDSWHASLNKIYSSRRKKVFEMLELLGCSFNQNQVGLFVWAKANTSNLNIENFTQHPLGIGGALSDFILYNAQVFLTPGGIFGNEGNNYIRVSLCGSIDKFEAAITKISNVI